MPKSKWFCPDCKEKHDPEAYINRGPRGSAHNKIRALAVQWQIANRRGPFYDLQRERMRLRQLTEGQDGPAQRAALHRRVRGEDVP